MRTGIDYKYVHYGIRTEALAMIETNCEKHEIDFEWLKEEILRNYHAEKVESIEESDDQPETIIRAAIQK